jgi:uncharacterized membrane protein YjfL (UPF0719 family)
MVDAFIDTLELFPRGLVYVGIGVVVLVIGKLVQDLLTPYKINRQLRTKDNVALGLSITGYYLGIVIVFVGAVYQDFSPIVADGLGFTTDYWQDVLEVFLTSLAGIAALNLARIAVDKLVLHRFSTERKIIDDQNAGTGAVEAGVYVASALVIAGSVSGEGGGPETSLAFAALGLLVLVLYTLFYELTTSFDIHEQIDGNNTAVGVALAGNLVAIGIVVLKAVFGDFVNWEEALAGFITFAAFGFGLLLAMRLVVDLIMFPQVKVADELAIDRNLGVALIESAVVVSASLILFFAI